MRLADIDLVATTGCSALHRAGPRSKLAATAAAVAAVVVSNNVLVVAAIALGVLALATGQRLQVGRIATAAAYPAFFALVFALAATTDPLFGALIVAKAITAALSVVVLSHTTPYPQILSPLQTLMPPLLADAFLMTYRSFFLLAEKTERLLRAARLRAGLSPTHPGRTLRVVAPALGGLLLYSIDLAQRDYDVLRLRGYDGRLRVGPAKHRFGATDAILLAGAMAMLGVASAWRVAYIALNPWSWLPAAAAALMLALAVARRLLWAKASSEPAPRQQPHEEESP